MRRLCLVAVLVAAVTLLLLTACIIVSPGASPYQSPYPSGSGGMMGGGGMMGSGGMMGGGDSYNPNAQPLTLDQVAEAVGRYLNTYGGDLILTEIMEFAQNFYAEVEEKETGIHAMELLIDKYTGQVYPEMGPNMMWNTKYGMMGNYYGGVSATAQMPITAERAKELAQKWLEVNLPGTSAAEADMFYGYYTLHTIKKEQIAGMLSVNGYTGAVWYHTWHGTFIGMKEFE